MLSDKMRSELLAFARAVIILWGDSCLLPQYGICELRGVLSIISMASCAAA